MTLVPVTHELLEDADNLRPLMHRIIRVSIYHHQAKALIGRWLYEAYGEHVDPQPFDPTALRPSLPYWPRPRR